MVFGPSIPPVRSQLRVALLCTTMAVLPVHAQTAPYTDDQALRDVVSAAYTRAGQPRTEDELGSLLATARPLITFDPRRATEADIVGLVGRLGLTDASLPTPPAAVSLTRTLSTDPLPDYGGADLTGRSATELAGMLQRGETTSREIILQEMYRIQSLDHAGPALRSVEQINPDILTLADQADARLAEARSQGRTLPPLFGVPALLKMNIGTDDGLRTTAGSAALIGSRPAAEATVVSGMLEQGLLILGKANMGQWAGLSSNNQSSTGGQTISPFDPSIAVAGSSSGPSVAAAMRFAPLTVGTQTSDSIIYPAQQQGLYALKPTAGLISTSGIAPYSRQVDTAGPLGNSVHDLALALNGMVKRDATDTRSKDVARPADYNAGLTGDLTGLKVGIYSAPPSEDPNRPANFDALVGGMLTASHAAVVPLDRARVDLAVKTAVQAMPNEDLARFVSFADASAQIPTDPAARAAFLNTYRQSFTDGAKRIEAATNGAAQFIFYDAYVSISAYLASRVSSADDYKSAFVRLLGDKFPQQSADPKVFIKTIDDLAAFAKNNPSLDGGDLALAFLTSQKVGPYASVDEFNQSYANWIRISTTLMANVRNALGVDAVIGFLGTDDDTNDGLGLFSFTTEQTSASPQLNVPLQVNGAQANILIDANPYQERTLLRIGQALQQQLGSDAYRQYQAVAPHPPAQGYADQPDDTGPRLPLVLKNLDDHGRATKAHLLTTEMAPLVLDVTGATMTPHFDGRISGNGGLIKDGAGIQILTGTSDFTGDVQVWAGGLAIDKTEALGALSNTVTLENKSALIGTRSFTLGRAVILRDGGTLGVTDGTTLVEDGIVSGNGGLFKTGGGTLKLLADNTYTGGTDIRAGAVLVSRDANLGQAYGAVTIGDKAVLAATASFATTRPIIVTGAAGIAVDPDTNLTAWNTVSGPGSLIKLGAGTLTLAGANTYRGGTAIASGTLSAANATALGAAAAAVAPGATLDVNDVTIPNPLIIAGDGAGGVGALTGTGRAGVSGALTLAGTAALGGPGTLTVAGSIGDGDHGFGLSKRGTGTAILAGINTYTGGTTVSEGTLALTGAGSLARSRGVALATGGTFDISGVSGTGPAIAALADTAPGQSGTVILGSKTLTLTNATGLFGGTIGGTGGLTLEAGTQTLTGAHTYTGPTTIGAGATLRLGAGGSAGSIAGTAGVANAGTLVFDRADRVRFAAAISGSGGLSQVGTGTTILTGANTYTGPTTIAGGTLSAAHAAALGTSSATVMPGGTLDVHGVTLGNALTLSGAGAGGVGALTGTGTAGVSGQITLAGTTALGGAGTLTLAGSIGDGGAGYGLAKLGTGTVILTAANTYAGGTTIAGGTLALSGTGTLGSPRAATVIAGATSVLDLGGTRQTQAAVSLADGGTLQNGALAAPVTAAGGTLVRISGPATLTTTGGTTVSTASTYSGATLVGDGSILKAGGAGGFSAASIHTLAGTGTLDLAGSANTVGALVSASPATLVTSSAGGPAVLTIAGRADGTFAGTIRGGAGPLGLALAGGSLTLTGTSTYTGATMIGRGATLRLGDGGTAGAITATSGVANDGTLVLDRADAVSFAPAISGSGSLTQAGPGTTVLTGRNTYTGATTVAAGTLQIDGVLSASEVTVRRGGTLSGTGKIGDPLIEAGGRLAPGGAALGTLAIHGPLTFAPGAFYTVRITPAANDRTDVTGPVTIQGGTVQVLAGSGTYTPALRYSLLTATGGITGTFTSLQTTSNLAFLTPSLSYEAHGIALGFAQTAPLTSAAATTNQAGIAGALNGAGPTVTSTPTMPGGATSAVTTSVSATGTVTSTVSTGAGTTTVVSSPAAQVTTALLNQTASGAVRALDSLSGEIQASAISARAQSALAVQGTLLEHLRFGAGGQRFTPGTTLPAGSAAVTQDESGLVPMRPLAPLYAVWGQAFGTFGASDANRNAARLTRETGGFMVGAETGRGVLGDGLDGWRVGAAGGSSVTQFDVTARQSFGRSEGSFGAAYARGALGPVQVRFGTVYGSDALVTHRTVLFPGFSQAISGRTGGRTLQGFGEVGYRIGGAESYVEPFVGGAALRLRQDRFTETGGSAALAVFQRSELIETATAGVQAQAVVADLFADAGPLLARGLIGYRRAFGDVTPSAPMAFRGASRAFRTVGAALARDAAVASVGLDWAVAPGTLVGLTYDGQIGARARDHAIKGSLSYRW